jgi:hypothetical protein
MIRNVGGVGFLVQLGVVLGKLAQPADLLVDAGVRVVADQGSEAVGVVVGAVVGGFSALARCSCRAAVRARPERSAADSRSAMCGLSRTRSSQSGFRARWARMSARLRRMSTSAGPSEGRAKPANPRMVEVKTAGTTTACQYGIAVPKNWAMTPAKKMQA